MHFEQELKDYMSSFGLQPDGPILSNTEINRFDVNGDRKNSKNGWYIVHSTNPAAVTFGCWKRGIKQTWFSDQKNLLTAEEKKLYRMAAKQAVHELKKSREAAYIKASERATAIWESASAVCNHPYLSSKNIEPYGIKVSADNKLIVPMYCIGLGLMNVQQIDPSGQKRFLKGCRTKGCFLPLGEPIEEELQIAEGYATAATLIEVTGIPTLVAFSAHNLSEVARSARYLYPKATITICADNDSTTPGNPGVAAAEIAAAEINAAVAMPPCHGDFNDYYNGGAHA